VADIFDSSNEFSGSISVGLHMANSAAVISVRVRVTLQLTVSQSVCLGVEPNLGLMTRDFFFKVTVLSFFGAPSLTRGRVCHLSVFVNTVYSDPTVI
jgi:hypothetical protein